MLRNLIVLLCVPIVSYCQRVDLDLFAGISNYQGDLQEKYFTFQRSHIAGAVNLKLQVIPNIYVRGGIMLAKLAGDDAYNSEKNRPRNLNFETTIQEFTLGAEYHFLKMDAGRLSPYLFAGGGVFHFDPYTYYGTGAARQKYYLQPLGTEGQGLSEYPDRKKYDLYKFCFFYGAGLKYQLNSVLNIGIEFRQTKTNTDYIDDVSTTYADENFLRAGNGQIAVDLAYRGDEYNGRSYPVAGTPRGNPNQDLYYFLGATVGLTLNDPNTGSFSLGGIFGHKGGRSNGARSQVACPRF